MTKKRITQRDGLNPPGSVSVLVSTKLLTAYCLLLPTSFMLGPCWVKVIGSVDMTWYYMAVSFSHSQPPLSLWGAFCNAEMGDACWLWSEWTADKVKFRARNPDKSSALLTHWVWMMKKTDPCLFYSLYTALCDKTHATNRSIIIYRAITRSAGFLCEAESLRTQRAGGQTCDGKLLPPPARQACWSFQTLKCFLTTRS